MAEKAVGITAAGNATYGTRDTLAENFDDQSNGGVATKSHRYDPIRCCGKWTSRKKLLVASVLILILLVAVVIVVIAVVLARKSKMNYREGVTDLLKDGSACPGQKLLQRECTSGDQFHPYATEKCIPLKYVCDGFNDCIGGEDEEHKLCVAMNRASPQKECSSTEWQCSISLKCINSNKRCDGVPDCPRDSSDEMGCVTINDEGLVEIIQENNRQLLSSEGMNKVLANSICLEIGYQELESYNPRAEAQRQDNCYKLSGDVDMDLVFNNVISFREAVQLQPCTDDELTGITCQVSTCGTFRKFTGPTEPAGWKEIHQHRVIETTDENFPWIVDIVLEGTWKCLGTIISGEWIITTSKCVDHFTTADDWTVKSGNNTNSPQIHTVWKHILHHDGHAVLLQIEPVIEYGNAGSHEICVGDSYRESMACFTAGMTREELRHVRVDIDEPQEDSGLVNFHYTHPDSGKACIESTLGGPISCFDPEFNSFTIIGIVDDDSIGCGGDDRNGVLFDAVERWTFAHALLARDDDADCPRSNLDAVRLSAGNRKNELIVEVLGIGQPDDRNKWFALYGNYTKNLEIILSLLDPRYQDADIIQSLNSNITSMYTVEPECPEEVERLCSCDFVSPVNNNARPVASFLIYSEFATQIEDIIAGGSDTFHGEDDSGEYAYDYFFPDYEDLYGDDNPDDNPEVELTAPPLPANISEGCIGNSEAQMSCQNHDKPIDCIPLDFRCDGFEDCNSGVDEGHSCPIYPVTTRECPSRDPFLCKYTYECIKKEEICNSYPECDDGYDETNCVRVLEQGHVQINRRGRWYLVSVKGLNVDEYHYKVLDIADEMCKDMGFNGASKWDNQTLTDRWDRTLELRCLIIAANNLDNDDVMTEKMTFSSGDCDTDFMVITCNKPSCGTFGNHTGPSLPEIWGNNTDYVQRVEKRNEYPWLLEISNSTLPTACYGSLLEKNWVITTRTCVPDLNGDYTVSVPGEPDDVKRTQITLINQYHNTDLDIVMFTIRKFSENVEDKVYPICIELDILYDHCIIRAQKKNVRVKMLPDCFAWTNKTLCFEFLHPENSSGSLTGFHGSPLACLNYLTNSWSLAGIVIQNEDAITSKGFAVDVNAVEGWVQTRLMGIDVTLNCQSQNPLPTKIRYQAASRKDTYYVVTEYTAGQTTSGQAPADSASWFSVRWDSEEPPSFFLKNLTDIYKLEKDGFVLRNAGLDPFILSRSVLNATNCAGADTSWCDCGEIIPDEDPPSGLAVQIFELLDLKDDYEWEK